jgi:hypothetical protein
VGAPRLPVWCAQSVHTQHCSFPSPALLRRRRADLISIAARVYLLNEVQLVQEAEQFRLRNQTTQPLALDFHTEYIILWALTQYGVSVGDYLHLAIWNDAGGAPSEDKRGKARTKWQKLCAAQKISEPDLYEKSREHQDALRRLVQSKLRETQALLVEALIARDEVVEAVQGGGGARDGCVASRFLPAFS